MRPLYPLLPLLLAALCVPGGAEWERIPERQQQVIQKGLSAAQNAAFAMKTLSTLKTVAKIGAVLGPLLTFATIAAEVAFLLIGVESEELSLMRTEFAALGDRLDRMSAGFGEVKRRIDWSAVQVAFAQHEATVHVLDRKRRALAQLSLTPTNASDAGQRRQAAIARFLDDFEHDFHMAAERLLVGTSGAASGSPLGLDVFAAASVYTRSHRRLTLRFVAGCVQLLVQACSVQLAYVHLKFQDPRAVDFLRTTQEARLAAVQANAARVIDAITAGWAAQAAEDVRERAVASRGQSHRAFAEALQAFLADKFDWRRWAVAAYAEREGFDEHAVSVCDGGLLFRVGGRNTVFASRERGRGGFARQWAWWVVGNVQFQTIAKDAAKKLLHDLMAEEEMPECYPAALTAVALREEDRDFGYAVDGKNSSYKSGALVYRCPDPKCWFRQDKTYHILLWG